MKILIVIFVVFIGIFVVGFLFSFAYVIFYNAKLTKYIKKEKYERWCELTSIGNSGPGLSNPYKSIPYVYNELDTDDKYILKHKIKTRFGLRLCLFIIIALFGWSTIGGIVLKFLTSK